VLGCPIRKSSDIMLVCSSPKLIAAYHVLLRLLEPRHPPCALICFKIIQIFKSLTSLKVTRYYNFFSQYVKELFLHRQPIFTDRSLNKNCQCSGCEPTDRITSMHQHHFIFKELFDFTPPLRTAARSSTGPLSLNGLRPFGCGGYRSRTDDPLLAKQVL
jgi:hypothetical protein